MIRIGPKISALVSRDAPLKKWTVIVPCQKLVPVDDVDQSHICEMRTRVDFHATVSAVNHAAARTEFLRVYPKYKGRRLVVRSAEDFDTAALYSGTFGGGQ